VFQPERVREQVGADEAFLDELLGHFLESAPEHLRAMRAACEDGEGGDRLEHAAHTLKANARTFGAKRLGRLCRRLEERGRTGRTGEEATAALVTEAEDAFERVREAVEAYRAPA